MARPNRKVPHTIRRNLLDQQFGEWTVIGFVGRKSGGIVWLCRCSCGHVKRVHATHLTTGRSSRCVFCESEKHGYSQRHGYSGTPTYRSWMHLKETGHFVARWRDFLAFLEDMGERPEDERLRRKDRSKRFGPSNCYWHLPVKLSKSVADKLRKTTNFPARRKLIEQLRKEEYTLQQIGDAAGVSRQAIHEVLKRPPSATGGLSGNAADE